MYFIVQYVPFNIYLFFISKEIFICLFSFIAKKTLFNNHLSLFFEPAKKSDGKETPQPNLRFLFIVAFRFFL